jgi:hypothetical protein
MTILSPSALRSTDLVKALTARMLKCPAEAYEVVSGARTWPPINDEHLDDLAFQAADTAAELIDMRNDGEFIPTYRIEKLLAAEAAFVAMSENEAEARKVARWAAEDMTINARTF